MKIKLKIHKYGIKEIWIYVNTLDKKSRKIMQLF